jgi:hypothetical protein
MFSLFTLEVWTLLPLVSGSASVEREITMAKTRFQETKEVRASSLSEPVISVGALVLRKEEEARPGSVVNVLPFFIIVAAMIGSAFYVHDQHVKQQRDLYSQYVSDNAAWRDPVVKEYAKITPYLDEFEKIDPSKRLDLVRIQTDFYKFNNEGYIFRGKRVWESHASNRVMGLGDSALDNYLRTVGLALLPEQLRQHKGDAIRARKLIRDDLYIAWQARRHQGDPKDFALEQRIALDTTAAMSDDELADRIAKMYPDIWASARFDRMKFEKALQTQEDVPAGLNIEYAKQLP